MAADKFTTMAESWNRFGNRGGWVLNCVRAFNDWEVDLVANLLFVLQKERASTELDNVTWKGATNATFSVRNAYILLAPNSGPLFPAKSIWVPSTPSKVAFFVWEEAWGKVLTLDKLQRRGWQFPNICYLCACVEESIHHILLHCLVVRPLWEIILSLVGISWVFPKEVKDLLLS